MKKLFLYLPLLLAIFPALPTAAQSLVISNHSFEFPPIGAGNFSTVAAPPGWSVYGNGINFGNRTIGVLRPVTTTLYAEPVPLGQNCGVTFLMDNQANQTFFAGIEAGMQQTLTNLLQAGRRYTLRVDVGNIANDVNAPFAFAGFPNYRIDLLAGANVLRSDLNTLLPAEGRFLTSTVSVSIAASHPRAGQPLGIRLVNLNSAPGIEVNWDNVRLDVALLPMLTIEHEVLLDRIRLSWPDSAAGNFFVEAKGTLAPLALWSDVPITPVLNAGIWSLSLPTPPAPFFFRLRSP
jgi:hypothetical protein